MMPATLKLYEIAQAREILDTWLAESEGELTPELEAMLDELDGKADEKIERVALFIRERLAQADAVKVERDRLAAIAKREEKAAESLKNYLHRQMDALGKTKVNGLLATVAIQRNSQPSVQIALQPAELFALPDASRYVKREEVVTYTVDRAAILSDWKANIPLPSMIVVDLGSHVRIR